MSKTKILIFGTGGLYHNLKKFIFSNYDVIAFYDNDITKQGQYLDGKIILHVDEELSDDYQFILVASMYFIDIRAQLLSKGIIDAKIKNIKFDILIGRQLWLSRRTLINKKKQDIIKNMKFPLLIIINSLRAGGAERALINLLELLGKRGTNANVISIYGGGVFSSQVMSPHVYIELFQPEDDVAAALILNTIPEFYETIISDYFDTVVSFLEGPATLLGSFVSARNRIAWCHTNLKTYHWTSNFFINKDAERNCYNKFDKIIFVSQSGLAGFCELYPDINVQKSVVPNIFNTQQIIKLANNKVSFSEFTFITVGRLTAVKGFERLIIAFSEACHLVSRKINLVIIGAGEDYERLTALIISLGLTQRVSLMGYADNPYQYMSAADVYISSSLTEGHPLSIGEALILGLPVVATDNNGSKNILHNGDYGLLIENSINGLLFGIVKAVNDENFLPEYAAKAIKGASQFSHEKIVDDFLAIIKQ